MNETNNDQKQESETSNLAIVSFTSLMTLLFMYLLLMIWSSFVEEINIPGLDIAIFFISVVVPIIALVLGLISFIQIKCSKKKLKGTWLSVASIIISLLLIMFIFLLMPQLGRASPSMIRSLRCRRNLRELGAAIIAYANEHDGYLPTADKWCDLLVTKADVNPKSFLCPESDAEMGKSSYAFNKNIAGMKHSEIQRKKWQNQDIVLLFETEPGWNQVGGSELLNMDNHEWHDWKMCNILFADGHVFVGAKDLETLRWEP